MTDTRSISQCKRPKLLPALVTLCLFLGLFNQAYAIEVSGEVGTDVPNVWTIDNSPYIVTGTVTVPSGQTLTIMQDVTVSTIVPGAAVFVEVGGRLVANGVTFEDQDGDGYTDEVIVEDGGALILDDCTLLAQIDMSGVGSAQVSNSTFLFGTPIVLNGSADLSGFIGNQWQPGASILVAYNVTAPSSWSVVPGTTGNLSRYLIPPGRTEVASQLTINPGVTVWIDEDGSDLAVVDGGTLTANGVTFQNGVNASYSEEIISAEGGVIDIDASTFLSTLELNSSVLPQVSNSRFLTSIPLVLGASVDLSGLVGNEWQPGASILVAYNVTAPSSWSAVPGTTGNLSRYLLTPGRTEVESQLTINPGVTIWINNTTSYLAVVNGGSLVASGVTFEESINNGVRDTVVDVEGGSIALSDWRLDGALGIVGSSTSTFVRGELTQGHVYTSGLSSETIDMRQQWWGTTDELEIEGKITHQTLVNPEDDPGLPLVLYEPWLTEAPRGIPSTIVKRTFTIDAEPNANGLLISYVPLSGTDDFITALADGLNELGRQTNPVTVSVPNDVGFVDPSCIPTPPGTTVVPTTAIQDGSIKGFLDLIPVNRTALPAVIEDFPDICITNDCLATSNVCVDRGEQWKIHHVEVTDGTPEFASQAFELGIGVVDLLGTLGSHYWVPLTVPRAVYDFAFELTQGMPGGEYVAFAISGTPNELRAAENESAIKLRVIAPDGTSISREESTIPNANYVELRSLETGVLPAEMVFIGDAADAGNYTVEVLPTGTATSEALFALFALRVENGVVSVRPIAIDQLVPVGPTPFIDDGSSPLLGPCVVGPTLVLGKGGGQIELTWQEADGATGYSIYSSIPSPTGLLDWGVAATSPGTGQEGVQLPIGSEGLVFYRVHGTNPSTCLAY